MDAALYDYYDERGRRLYRVRRSHPKKFEIFSSAGRKLNELPARTVLYKLPELLAANASESLSEYWHRHKT